MKLEEHYSFVLDGQATGFRFQERQSFYSSRPPNTGTPPSVLSAMNREFYLSRKVDMAWNWQLKPTYIYYEV